MSASLCRTNRDKQAAVEAALKHPKAAEMSNYEVAAHCGVAEITIRRARESHCDNGVVTAKTYTTKHGTRATMDTTNIGKAKPKPPESKPAVAEREPQVLGSDLQDTPNDLSALGRQIRQGLGLDLRDTPLSLLGEALGRAGEFPSDWIERVRQLLG